MYTTKWVNMEMAGQKQFIFKQHPKVINVSRGIHMESQQAKTNPIALKAAKCSWERMYITLG